MTTGKKTAQILQPPPPDCVGQTMTYHLARTAQVSHLHCPPACTLLTGRYQASTLHSDQQHLRCDAQSSKHNTAIPLLQRIFVFSPDILRELYLEYTTD